MGALSHQLTGTLEYKDEENELYGVFNINPSRWKKQDVFTGEIKRSGETICKINGNYMGYFDIDDVRYWDIRDKDSFFTPSEIHPENLPGVLPSDSTFRRDYKAMLT